MNRRILTLLVALAPIVAFGVLLGAVTVPYVSLGPGPTFDTLGKVEGKEVVDIDGTQEFPTTGHLNMTTVAQRDQLTLGQALALWMSGREQLVPRDLVFPPDKSREEVDKGNTADFEASEFKAEYAALGYLKYPQALTVEVVNDDGPSHDKLQPGDAIDKVNGTPITGVDQFQELLKKTKPGQDIVVDYRRKNAPPGTTTITLGKNEDREYGYLGVAVREAPWAPFEITFNLANVGGPSAGLMFALAVVDKLTTGDSGGRQVHRGHRHHRQRRQGRADRRHHPQDARRARSRGQRLLGARRQLCRGARRQRRRPRPGQGGHPRPGGRRAESAFCRGRTSSLLKGLPVR